MAEILHDSDADLDALKGQRIATVGYGNQGRSWALNLRDSGLDVSVHARADESREQATQDGFDAHDIPEASDADVICILVPDDVIPKLPLTPKDDALVVVASGYTLAFGRLDPACDVGMVAPRMLGPEVRRCYEEGVGFITAVGVHQDATGTARARTLAVANAIGGLRQGAIEMTPMQEAVLDLAVEQALSPALRKINETFVGVMMENGIPLEAIMTELFLSGEVERTYRLVRLEGGAAQTLHHSPTSQYGQLSRIGRYDHLDVGATMRDLVAHITSGDFADEWDAERDNGYPQLEALKAKALAPEILEFEEDLRLKLGERAVTGYNKVRWPQALYNALVVLHVVSVAVGFGAIALTGGYARDAVAHAERTSDTARWFAPARGIRWSRLAFWSVPVLGIALVIGHRRYELGQSWLWASLASWVAAAVLAQRIVFPGQDAITDALELRQISWSGGAAADEVLARTCTRVSHAAAAIDVLFVAALVLMLIKPGLPR